MVLLRFFGISGELDVVWGLVEQFTNDAKSKRIKHLIRGSPYFQGYKLENYQVSEAKS